MKQLQRKLHFFEKTTYFLILLFLPTQLGKHFWPSWSQVLGLRIDYLSPTVYLTDIFIILLFTAWAINKFSIFNFQFSMKFSVKFKLLIFNILNLFQISSVRQAQDKNFKFQIIIFAVVLVVGIVFSKSPMSGWYGLLKLLEFGFFGWYTAGHIKRISHVAAPLAIGIVFESMLAFLQVFTQGSIGSIFYWFGERTFSSQTPGIANASLDGALFLRPYATFSHPNVLAGFLTIAMAIVISKTKYEKSKTRKHVYALAVLIGTLALFLTLSRVAIILWIAILIAAFLFGRKQKRAQKARIAIFLIAAAVVLFFTPLPSRFLQTPFMDESLQLRFLLSQSALLMAQDHPFFGVGVYNFIPSLPFYQHAQTTSLFSMFQPVHNIFLLIVAETGIVGLGLFLWFIAKTYRQLKFQISNSRLQLPSQSDGGQVKFKILCMVLILGMFDHYLLTLQQGQLLFALVFGLCWSRRDTIGKDS